VSTLIQPADYLIKIDNALIYQGKMPVLENINLRVTEGEFVFLVGRTGSGKSSLLKALYGELPLVSGTAEIAGFQLKDIKSSQIPFLRRSLGIVFQDFQLLMDRSAMDNLLFVMQATGWKSKQEMSKRANEVLNIVGLDNKGYKWPNELSGGEQQRLVIARALLNNPKVVLADEPTGSLDPTVSDEVMELLQHICSEGTAVLMATHDYRLIHKFGGSIYEVKDKTVQAVPDVNHLNW